MKKEEVVAKLKGIVANRLDVEEDQVTEDKSFVEDLGADSLDIVELIMGIEDEFGIEIPDSEAEKLLSIQDVVTFVENFIKSAYYNV